MKFTVCLERKPLGAELALMGSHPEMSILYMGVTVGLGGKGHGAILGNTESGVTTTRATLLCFAFYRLGQYSK